MGLDVDDTHQNPTTSFSAETVEIANVASLLGADPSEMIREDLKRLKSLLEESHAPPGQDSDVGNSAERNA
jgi:uncharacterized membrane protein